MLSKSVLDQALATVQNAIDKGTAEIAGDLRAQADHLQLSIAAAQQKHDALTERQNAATLEYEREIAAIAQERAAIDSDFNNDLLLHIATLGKMREGIISQLPAPTAAKAPKLIYAAGQEAANGSA